MTKYAAFLRGVNVGGRTAKMSFITETFTSLKLKNVQSFMQNGNIIFETSAKNTVALRNKIEKKLESLLSYEVKVFLKSPEQIKNIVERNPFKNKKLNDDTKTFVAILYNLPGEEIKDLLLTLNNKNEKYHLVGNEVFCLIKRDERRGFFAILKLEKKIGIPLTQRQVKTIDKLNNMLSGHT